MMRQIRIVARAYLMSIAFWFGIAFLMGWQYGVLDRHHLWQSFMQLLEMAAVRGFSFALWTPPIFYLVSKYLRFSNHRVRYVLCCALGAVPFVVLHSAIQWVLIPPFDDVQHKVLARSFHTYLEYIRGGFADQTFIYIAMVVGAHAYEYLKRLRREEREKYEYQQALVASELQALQMQLHPHFLFNSLHGIATLVDADSNNARNMIIKLSDLLRTALNQDNVDLVCFQDELRFVREYLDLEKMRFGSRLQIEWQISPATDGLLVPKMILQPLVENAIRHGVSCAREGGWVLVAATQKDGVLEIQVRNSVGGSSTSGTGVGLRNTEARLKYLYSGDASLRLAVSEDHVATASLTIPALHSRPISLERHGDDLVRY